MPRVIDFRERLADLQSIHARAVARFIADNNAVNTGRAMNPVTYRNMVIETSNSARAVADAADEIVWWMGYHADVREADGLPPTDRIG